MAEKVNAFWCGFFFGLLVAALTVWVALRDVARDSKSQLPCRTLQEPELIGYPGYIEQDEKTVTVHVGNQVIVAEWLRELLPGEKETPLLEEEVMRRWRERDGTVFKIVPRGGTP